MSSSCFRMVLVTLALFGALNLTSCRCSTSTTTSAPAGTTSEVEGVKIEILRAGTGAEATDGREVSVHYTGTLEDGTKFDSSVDRNMPFNFILGAGMVIKGWDIGVKGMKVGEKRNLTIPPELAYGDRAIGNVIPANSTLFFEVELLDVK